MDPQLLLFQQEGLQAACTANSRTVTFKFENEPREVGGVRTEIQVDPGEVQPGGFRYKRVFSLTVSDKTVLDLLKTGTEVTDDLGQKAKFVRYNANHLGLTLFFGSVHA